jgi:hypothetical protein
LIVNTEEVINKSWDSTAEILTGVNDADNGADRRVQQAFPTRHQDHLGVNRGRFRTKPFRAQIFSIHLYGIPLSIELKTVGQDASDNEEWKRGMNWRIK